MRNKEQVGLPKASLNAKTLKSASYDELDRALYIWFRQMREKNIPISGPILMEKVW